MRPFSLTLLLALGIAPAYWLAAASPLQTTDLSAKQGQELVARALANEIRATEDTSHPMRYRLRKMNPSHVSTKNIIETRDGDVAQLIAIDDAALTNEAQQKEQARLRTLLNDPSRQRHRQQAEADDLERAMKIVRALPEAFLYQFAGMQGAIARFTFRPNPEFHSQSLETQALTATRGELWINTEQERVTHFEGHLEHEVNFGWGILGRLNKGGWIAMDQTEIAPHLWRNTHFKMGMTGRVVYKTKVFDTVEDLTQFTPVRSDLDYKRAIHLLQDEQSQSALASGN